MANGVINAADAVDGTLVQIPPYSGMAWGDTITLDWNGHTYEHVVTEAEANKVGLLPGVSVVIEITVPAADLAGVDAAFEISYTVTNAEGHVSPSSPTTHVVIDTVAPGTPEIVQGSYVVTWESANQDGSPSSIYGQRFTADGTKLGTEFKVNTHSTDQQLTSSVTALVDGGYVVTWQSYGQDGTSSSIYGQRFAADGTPSGEEFKVNTYSAGQQMHSSVTALADGGYVVTWQSYGQDGSHIGIYGQRFAADGTPSGEEFKVNTDPTGIQRSSSVTALADGGYVVTWESLVQDASSIYGRRFAADGTPSGEEFKVNTYSDGQQMHSSVTALADGGYVVTWQSYGQDGTSSSIYGQRFAADGTPSGEEFKVNTYPTGIQLNSSVTALVDGGYVVTWQSRGQDGSPDGIYGQRFAADGTPSGDEFQVSTGRQGNPSVTGLADGGYVVMWNGDQDGSPSSVYGQRFAADGTKLGTEFEVNTHTIDVQKGASVTGLHGDLVLNAAEVANGASVLVGLGGTGAVAGDTLTLSWGGQLVEHVLTADDILNGYGRVDVSASTIAAAGNGDIIVQVQLTDIAGNSSGWSMPETVLVGTSGSGTGGDTDADTGPHDLLAPVVPEMDDGVINAMEASHGTTVKIPAYAGMAWGDTITLDWNGHTYEHVVTEAEANKVGLLPGVSVVIEITVPAADLAGVDAAFEISYTVTNAEGHVSPSSPTTHVVIDTVAPGTPEIFEGSYVVTWAGDGQDGTGQGIYGQRFTADGMKLGTEFKVNTFPTGNRTVPSSVTALVNGGYVVTWGSEDQDGSRWLNIYGQRFAADGTPSGEEFEVYRYMGPIQAFSSPVTGLSVTGLADGGYVVTWSGVDWLLGEWNVYGQRFAADGTKFDQEFQVNMRSLWWGEQTSVIALAGGGYVVTWGSPDIGARGQSFAVDGTKVEKEFLISVSGEDTLSVTATALADGGYVVTWTSHDNVYGQRFAADGTKLDQEFQVNTYPTGKQGHPSVTALADGGYVVTWDGAGQDGSPSSIYGQRFDVYGKPYGKEFEVNTHTDGLQTIPSVTALADGGYVVTWQSANQDGSPSSIYGQRFAADGTKVGKEFEVNTYTDGKQGYPSVTGLHGDPVLNAADVANGTSVLVGLGGTGAVAGDTLTLSWGGELINHVLTSDDIRNGYVSVDVSASTIAAAGNGDITVQAQLTDIAGNSSGWSTQEMVLVGTSELSKIEAFADVDASPDDNIQTMAAMLGDHDSPDATHDGVTTSEAQNPDHQDLLSSEHVAADQDIAAGQDAAAQPCTNDSHQAVDEVAPVEPAGPALTVQDEVQVHVGHDGGLNVLKLDGEGQVLNLSALTQAEQVQTGQAEVIDITGTGDNTLKLSLGDVLSLGEKDLFLEDGHTQLLVKGDAGDKVDLSDLLPDGSDVGDWAQQSGTTTVGVVEYDVYYNPGLNAELLVQHGVETTLNNH
ncbi:hypothetical protein KNO81_39340 [Paraburkholderia sediminicola]|nr:hypothetical protein [Paraburkholderia sediminicola]